MPACFISPDLSAGFRTPVDKRHPHLSAAATQPFVGLIFKKSQKHPSVLLRPSLLGLFPPLFYHTTCHFVRLHAQLNWATLQILIPVYTQQKKITDGNMSSSSPIGGYIYLFSRLIRPLFHLTRHIIGISDKRKMADGKACPSRTRGACYLLCASDALVVTVMMCNANILTLLASPTSHIQF